MISYPHVAQRLFNTPLAITPQKAEIIVSALRERFGIVEILGGGRAGPIDDHNATVDIEEPYNLASEVIDGVMVIRVEGTLVHKLGTMQPYCGMTGYDSIRANLALGMADDSVRAIVFDMDSCGGEVSGCFDLVDAIYQARGTKPMWSLLSECAYSAAYAIASATDKIIVPRTGGTGSVGVISMVADLTKALDKAGVKVHIIRYGANKAEGNGYEALSDDALARMQADIDMVGELFVDTVARNRNLKASAVRGTEARTFLGAAGVEIGFADAVMAPDEAFSLLLAELG